MKFKINIKSLHLSLNTFEEELAGRKSGSEICVKSLVVTYMLNLSQQYDMAAKKANVLLVCADEEQRLERGWRVAVLLLLVLLRLSVECVWFGVLHGKDVHKLKFILSGAAKILWAGGG